ncbi:unnamed protein product [Medioppia subpectinata]|uniref:Beta-N-acetylhexosaminidase n=1 Tax=Medioppia subpectinata TaxID=1979941 RepID=A0A7R9L8K2_9ACAR|nr:unnamed protein product [Medioppia subpectinata]CAG2116776.1 unnamed protein product [Medioppia subpectinata]
MLRQMIAGHQRWTQLDAIHIGCDEVWHLGHCQRCRQYLTDHCLADKSQLFLRYVRKVAEFVRKTFDIKVIVWDDMMRHIDDQTLADSGLNRLVEPMVWHYLDAECFQLRDPQLWSKYKHSFDRIWIASAFKGAAKMNQMLPPVDHYISNHLAWVRVIEDNQLAERVAGLALTGWQRFDHMTTLCELMPNSMVSLMMCLFAFNERDFNEDIQRNVSTFIGNKQLIPIDINSATDLEAIDSDVYPGVDLFKLCNEWQFLVKEFNELKSNQSFEGAFTSYQISLNRTNPLHIEAFLLKARVLLFRVQQMRLQIETEMKKIFYDTTVEEWIHTNVIRISKKLDKIVTNGDQQLATHVN